MAIFINRGGENSIKMKGAISPTSTTILADGYTEDGQLSRYENVTYVLRILSFADFTICEEFYSNFIV